MGIGKSIRVFAGALIGVSLLVAAGSARCAEPVTIRTSYVVAPASLLPILFPVRGIAREEGKSYELKVTKFGSTAQIISALAAGDIDVAELSFSTFGLAIENAGITDLRVIADEIQDGAPGYASGQFAVLSDSPIHKIEDLKGKVVATNAIGVGGDIMLRAVLRRHGLVTPRDYSDIEVPFPSMVPMLKEHKINLGLLIAPFLYQAEAQNLTRPLFRQRDAFGTSDVIFLTSRASFLRQHRQAMVDFLEDYIRSIRWYTNPANHEGAVAAVAKFTKLPPKVLGYLFTKRDYFRDPDALPNLEAIQKTVSATAKLGFLKRNLDVKHYADLSLVNEAAKRVQ